MRVLFLSDSTTVSGAELVMLAHLRALAGAGGTGHVVLRRANRRLAEVLASLGVPSTACDTYPVEELRTTLAPRLLAGFAVAFARTRALLRPLIGQLQPDLLHCVSYPAVLYGLLGAAGSGTPVVWHEHNIKRLHWVNQCILRFAGSRCHSVLGPSNAVTGHLAAAGVAPARLRTVYNGVDLSRFQPAEAAAARARAGLGLDALAKAVGLPGQLLPYKGHRVLIEAAAGLARAHPTVQFFFLGALENPAYRAELEQRCRALGLEDRFVFTGWRTDVHEILQAMDVVVVPTTRPEPAALTVIEAMALARPVVATRTGGTPELVVDGETGVLIEPDDAGALGSALDRLLTDAPLAQRLGAAGRRRVEAQFTMSAHQAAILGLYREIVAARRL